MFRRSTLTLFLVLIVLSAQAQVSHDFSNNLAGDLGPLISLLGDSMTRQYLSESTTILDYLIFSLAPIGILTVLVSVIRVCGGTALRAFIGRAQEGPGVIEAELGTSTSRDVCELFNSGGITRVLGKPNILEIIYIPEISFTKGEPSKQKLADIEQSEPEILLFREHLTRISKKHVIPNDEEAPKGDWKLASHHVEMNPRELHFPPNPNLTLNVGIHRRSQAFFCMVATAGFLLQAGVLIAAGLGTYRYSQITKPGAKPWANPSVNETEVAGPSPTTEPGAKPSEDEVEPSPNLLSTETSILLFFVGTVLLTAGMFVCAMLIGGKTRELDFERSQSQSGWRRYLPKRHTSDQVSRPHTERTKLFWLQPGAQVIGDQTFDAFAYTEREKAVDNYVTSRLKTKNELRHSRTYTWIAVILTAGGFICQFIGLRGLGPIIALSQLGITLIMSFIRGMLRSRSLEEKDNKVFHYIDLVLQHELDWLASQLPRDCKVSHKSDLHGKDPHEQSSFFVLGHRWSSSSQNGHQDCSCIVELYERRHRLANLTGHYSTGFPNYEFLPWEDDVVKVRKKSKKLARVLCETAEILNGGEGAKDVEIHIPIVLRNVECVHDIVTITVHAPTDKDSRGWWVDSSQLESVLGLWLWSLKCNAAKMNDINDQWESHDKFITKARIVGAAPVSKSPSKDEDLQTQLSLWMGGNSGNIEQGELLFDPSTSAGPADLFSEVANTNQSKSGPVPLEQLSSLNEGVAQKTRRFFGWTALRNLGVPDQTSGTLQTPQVNASQSAGSASNQGNGPFARRITVFYVAVADSSEFPELLLDECVRDIYCLGLMRMITTKFDLGKVSTEQKFGQLRLKNATISALTETFTHPDNDLGSNRDAHLCILPAFHNQLENAYGAMLLTELIEAAHVSRRSRQWQAAERFLLFAYSACEKTRSLSTDHAASSAIQESITHLVELYRWALTEPSDLKSRQFAYLGYQRLGEKLVDQASHGVKVDHYLQDILSRYTALASKIASTHNETFNLSSAAFNLIKPTFEIVMRELELPIPADSLFDQFRRTIEAVDNTLTEDQIQFCFSIKHEVRFRTWYYLCKSQLTPEVVSKRVLHPFLATAASHGWTEIVDVLLEQGVPIDSQDESGKTALIHFAAAGDHGRVQKLLEKGALAYHEDKFRCGVLFYASKHGHDLIAKALLDMGSVYPNGNPQAQYTPLSAAAYHGHERVVKLLLSDSRIEPDDVGQNELTPIIAAVLGGDLATFKLLWENGVDLKKFALGHPLLVAAFMGSCKIVEELITDKQSPVSTNLDHPNIDGEKLGRILNKKFDRFMLRRRTAITLAAERGHLAVVEFLLNQPGTLTSPTLREIQDESGKVFNNSAIWYAAASGHEKVVRVLLDAEKPGNPSLNIRGTILRKHDNPFHYTPLEIAFAKDHPAALQTLLSKYPWSLPSSSNWTWSMRHDPKNVDRQFLYDARTGHTSHVEARLRDKAAPVSVEAANMALALASRPPLVQLLLDSGLCDPNLAIPFLSETFCHDPAFDGIENEVESRTGLQRTLLFDAALENRRDVVSALLTHPQTDINIPCRPEKDSGDIDVKPLDYLPALWCIFNKSWFGEITEMLLNDSRIDLMGKRQDGQYFFTISLQELCNDKDGPSVLAILEHRNFDINKFAINESHPLGDTAALGFECCVEKIMMDLDIRLEEFQHVDDMDEHPLYRALQEKHFGIARLLVADGRCVNPALVVHAVRALHATNDEPSSGRRDIVSFLMDYIYDEFGSTEQASEFVVRSFEGNQRCRNRVDLAKVRSREDAVEFFLDRLNWSASSSDESDSSSSD